MQISPLVSKDNRHQAAGIVPGASQDKPQELAAKPRSSGDISVKAQRHGQWALMSQAQFRLSTLQSMEQAVVNTYRQLVGLARQLEQNQSQSQALANQARALAHQVDGEGLLDGALAPRRQKGEASFLLTRVDLLSQRSQAETVKIGLPNGASLSLRLGAQASQGRVLADLGAQLARQGISVSSNSQGQLLLSGPEKLFASPWQFQGQGIRVPAGNPVPITLDVQPQVLDQMAQGLAAGNVDYEKARLRALLAALEQHRKALAQQRQQLMQKMESLRSQALAAGQSPEQLGESVKTLMREGDFTLQLNTLMAQANLSRQSVVALLAG
ncbi:hypothetical protein [Gallaecimonas xiamenensis]|nr:hypothetical protein [Gallaecimonas xiamenensis]